jgi:hypothetical protein
MSIRDIARRTGLPPNTVKKYLRSDDPKPRCAKRVSTSRLDPYAEKLSTWLGIEATNRGNSGALCGKSMQSEPKPAPLQTATAHKPADSDYGGASRAMLENSQ